MVNQRPDFENPLIIQRADPWIYLHHDLEWDETGMPVFGTPVVDTRRIEI